MNYRTRIRTLAGLLTLIAIPLLAGSAAAAALSGIWYGSLLQNGAVQRVSINADASTIDLPGMMVFDEPAQFRYSGSDVAIEGDGFSISGSIDGNRLIANLSIDGSPSGAIQAIPNPKRVIRGRDIPSFDLTLFESGDPLSSQDLSGKYYLLDFWATWCPRCKGEIPNLASAYGEFEENVTFLSISVDEDPAVLKKFLSQESAMPWLHANVNPESDLVREFEIAIRGGGLPFPVLVSPDGEILAAGLEELQGFRLRFMLNRFVGSVTTN